MMMMMMLMMMILLCSTFIYSDHVTCFNYNVWNYDPGFT